LGGYEGNLSNGKSRIKDEGMIYKTESLKREQGTNRETR